MEPKEASCLLPTQEVAGSSPAAPTIPHLRISNLLKGDLKGLWSLTVTGNWRLIFRYDEKTDTASDIDLIDYH